MVTGACVLSVDDAHAMLAAVRRARQQCQIRMAQLAQCRVCAVEAQAFTETVELLRQLESKLEGPNVRSVQPQP